MNKDCYEIIPLVRVGPVKLSMDRHDVESIFGEPEFERDNRVTYFSGFMIDYDDLDKVEFIELAKSEDFDLVFEGVYLQSLKANDVIKFMEGYDSYDKSDPEVGYCYVFKKLQLSFWRSSIPDSCIDTSGQYFEAIGVGRSNYF